MGEEPGWLSGDLSLHHDLSLHLMFHIGKVTSLRMRRKSLILEEKGKNPRASSGQGTREGTAEAAGQRESSRTPLRRTHMAEPSGPNPVLSLGWLWSPSCLACHSEGAFLSGPSLGGQAPAAWMCRSREQCFESSAELASSFNFQTARLYTLPSRVILTTAQMQRGRVTGLRSHRR